MDGDWGNIIYLIAAVLFGIISMFKKKKQPNAVSPPDVDEDFEQPTVEPSSGFDSVLETLLGVEMPKQNAQTIKEQELEPEPARQETMMEEYERKEKEKAALYTETKNESLSSLDSLYTNEVDEIEAEDEEKEEIDWRQAIIYKEILDRKYN